jgi:hypothetical protein
MKSMKHRHPNDTYFARGDEERQTLTSWLLGYAEWQGVIACFIPHSALQDGLRADWPNPSLQVVELREPISSEDSDLVLKGSPFLLLCATLHFDNVATASNIAATIANKHVRCRILFCDELDFDQCYKTIMDSVNKRNRQATDPFLSLEKHYWGAAVVLRVARVDLSRGYVA